MCCPYKILILVLGYIPCAHIFWTLLALLPMARGTPEDCSFVVFVNLGAIVGDMLFVPWFCVASRCDWKSPNWGSYLCLMLILIAKILADFIFAFSFGLDCLDKSALFTRAPMVERSSFFLSLTIPFYEMAIMSLMACIQLRARQPELLLQESIMV